MMAILAIASCVPKASDKKAVCGEDEDFSSVSRSCYSIQEKRAKPVATTTYASVSRESPTIILKYNDANNDGALTCKITSFAQDKVEMINPSAVNGELNKKADELYSIVSNLALAIGVSNADMFDALSKAKASYYFPSKKALFDNFKTEASLITAAGSGSNSANAKLYYNLALTELQVLSQKLIDLANRCECSGGVCSTTAISKSNTTVSSAFSYTVKDVDGESNDKPVTLTLTPISSTASFLAPVAESSAVVLKESNTPDAISYNFTLPTAADLTTADSIKPLKYIISNSSTLKGNISNCKTESMVTSCEYKPFSGDAFGMPSGVDNYASVVIDDLTFTAITKGAVANNFNIQYFNIKNKNIPANLYVNEIEKYSLVTNPQEAFIRVVGNSIKIFIQPGVTTYEGIKELVNNHPQASKLVSVVYTPALPSEYPEIISPVFVSPKFLMGGESSFDEIFFYAENNLGIKSLNTSSVRISMTRTNDYALFNPLIVAASEIYEDEISITVNLKNISDANPAANSYSNIDTVDEPSFSNECEIDLFDPLSLPFYTAPPTCSCVLDSCSATFTPIANASSMTPFTFRYRIVSVDPTAFPNKIRTEFKDYNLTIKPINDIPNVVIGDLYFEDQIVTSLREGQAGYVDVIVDSGDPIYEADQMLELKVTDATSLFPNNNIVITPNKSLAGTMRINFPADNQSGEKQIKFSLKDNGGVARPGFDVDTLDFDYNLKITPVNNVPVFITNAETPEIVKIETNEGGAVQSGGFLVDEDAANSEDEDRQSITIDLESDNHSVLPVSAIKIFYDLNDNGVQDVREERALLAVLEDDASKSASLHKFYLKLDPVDGVAGNANITIKITDNLTNQMPEDDLGNVDYEPKFNTISKKISLVVHPVAALHGGWNNISSVGIKTDKFNKPVSPADIKCNFDYDKDNKKCGRFEGCTDRSIDNTITLPSNPVGTIVPGAANVVYWDSSNLRCYRSTSASEFSWVDMNSTCPIKKTDNICPDNNCFNSGNPNLEIPADAIPRVLPNKIGQFILDTQTNTCFTSVDATVGNVSNWIEYTPAKVTLDWKSFILAGSGPDTNIQISGWNVYRREVRSDYNFQKNGHLRSATSNDKHTITNPSIRTFTDTTAIAGRIYYYTVRPVDNKRFFPTYTPESFSEVRVVAAPENYSFVHRWIVNQEICNGMHITNKTTPYRVDQVNNFRCEYNGPGSDGGFYDFGKDLLVDTQEIGCAYAAAPKCTLNGCVGIGAPTALNISLSNVEANDLYYDRQSGVCYQFNSVANDFVAIRDGLIGDLDAKTMGKMNSALNPPLTNLTSEYASKICSTREVPKLSYTKDNSILELLPTNVELPNKKDFMAYASQRIDLDDYAVSIMEQGNSLNIKSACNSSSANGLEIAYRDIGIPSTSFIYSLPGTDSSGIRSMYTGSIPWSANKGTEDCVSRFGIQDLYGNVAEWVNDGMTCGDGSVSKICESKIGLPGSFGATDFGTNSYKFDNVVGPYNENGDEITIYVPVLTTLTFTIGATSAPLANLSVGSTAGFANKGVILIGDEYISYDSILDATTLGSIVRGYNSTVATAHIAGVPVTFSTIDDTYLKKWTFSEQFFGANYFNYPLGLPLSNKIKASDFSAFFDWILPIGPTKGITDDQLHDDGIIVNGSSNSSKTFAVGGSYKSGKMSGRYSSELINDTVNNRPDVGFRCIIPILPIDYKDDVNVPF